MKRLIVVPVVFISAFAYSQDDTLLRILTGELNREVTEFAKTAQPPYFIDYRVNDDENALVSSSFGSLVQSYANHERLFHVQVRIGDYLVDNTHPDENNPGMMGYPYFGGDAGLPLDDNEDAIRFKLWKTTQHEYKMALERYKGVKNLMATKKEEKLPPDFSKAKVEQYYEKPGVKLAEIFNKEQWEEKTRQYSKLFLGDESILSAEVTVNVSSERRYYVSSEGASVVENTTSAYIYIVASIRATDGEVVPLQRSYFAPAPADLPSDEVVEADIKAMIVTLQKLKAAPLADPYTGPALLDGPVSGVFFHEIFGHRVEGHRLRSDMDGQTFKAKVNQKILPESISVYCDPGVKQFAGKYLNGVYSYDDEGVKAERVNVVERGSLKNFLMSRSPMDDFTHSNGHGRATAGLSPVSRQSNLFVDAVKTKSNTDLREMLIKECKRQKKEYGYFFKSVVGGFTTTDRYQPNAFNIFPTEVYRVYVDGRADELVRGVDLIGTPLAMFAEIAAVGDTPGVFTGFCGAESGYVPVSAISPSLFVRRIETQKKPKSKIEETYLKAPLSSVSTTDKLPVVQQAMRDEMERSMKELKADGFDKPFFINYTILDETSYQANATLGGLQNSITFKSREPLSIRLMVGDYEFNDESLDNNLHVESQANELSLPIDDDYSGIRRSLWISTDNVYRGASRKFAENKQILKEEKRPLAEVPHRSFAKVEPSKIDVDAPDIKFDRAAADEYIRKVSAVFGGYPEVEQSRVSFSYRNGYRYLVNSEGSMNRVPTSRAAMFITATVGTQDGISHDNLYYNSDKPEFQPLEKTIKETRKMIEAVIANAKAKPLEEEYIGPLLYFGHTAGVLMSQLFERPGSLVSSDVIAGVKGPRSFDPASSVESKIGRPVFAEGMTVKAIPKTKKYGDKILLGSYDVDNEGVVPADETVLIEDGVLKTLLNDRTLAKPGQVANGLSNGPGVFMVTFRKTSPLEQMKSKLIERAKKEGLDYGMMIKGLGDGIDNSTSYIYKVYVEDGREELAGDCDMKEFALRGFKKIVDVSDDMVAYNESRGQSSLVSVICPSAILFEEAEFGTLGASYYPEEEEYVPSPLKK